MQIAWKRVGPERPQSMEVPTLSMLLNGYVLDYDTARERVVYVCGPGYDGFGELWSYDGAQWTQEQTRLERLEGEGPYAGYYDASRGGVVVHHFGYDDDSETHRPESLLVTPVGLTRLETTGDLPAIGEDVGTFDPRGAFAYDHVRHVGVCLTPAGIWELDRAGVWSKAAGVTKKLVPAEWKDACGGCYDPVREHVLLWLFDGDDYKHRFYAWNGKELLEIPGDGLPHDELHIGLFDPSALIATHAKLGVVLYAGPAEGIFAFDGKAWKKVREEQDGPPRMKQAAICHDPGRDLLVVGPGFHEGDAGGREAQRVFFVGREGDGTWERQGVIAEGSPLARLHYHRRYFIVGDVPHATRARRSLHTFAWRDGAWQEIVDEKTGDALLERDDYGAVVGTDDGALMVTQKGAEFTFDGKSWTKGRARIPDFGERVDFTIVRVPTDPPRLVVWGGEVKNRKTNDTFLCEANAWRKAKKPSPRPKDFAHGKKDHVYVDFDAVWDSALGRVVRFGFEEVHTLEGELWQAHVPIGYRKLCGSRHHEHFPVHDPRTGETLLMNLVAQRIVRFDLKRCEEVCGLALPQELDPKEQHDSPAWARIDEDLWYDAATRTLHAQYVEDKWARYAWDLGPAFDAAKEMGPRTLPAPPEPSAAPAKPAKVKGAKKKAPTKKAAETPAVEPGPGAETAARLYVIDDASRKHWSCEVTGTTVVTRWGRIGAKPGEKKEKKSDAAAAQALAARQIADKRKKGYVDASALPLDALASLAAVSSRAIRVGKTIKGAPKDHAIDRIGGLPSGVSERQWPKREGRPLGFLFQLRTEGVLEKHAGVAVFCTTDGTATEDQDQNAVVLLSEKAWSSGPLSKPPGDVPVLAARPLTLEGPRYEVLEERAQELAEGDPLMGAAIDRLQGSGKVYDDVPWSKLGGAPAFVQGGDLSGRVKLVAQLDFDGITLEGPWKESGLFGVIYIFATQDEKQGFAFWQYT